MEGGIKNFDGFEENEVSNLANGGTEISKRSLQNLIRPDLLKDTQIICSRPRELKEDKIRIFYANDLPWDNECAPFKEPAYRNKFHKFIFVSNWQMEAYLGHLGFDYSSKNQVIETGIDIITPVPLTSKNPDVLNIVYTSMPNRGFNILVPVFKKLSQEFPGKLHLHVASSFLIYGWEEQDKVFYPIYDEIKSLPNATYHGFLKHDKLLKLLEECHVFAYPCTWPETSCRALIEAMASGLLCVHPNFAGLSATAGGMNFVYQGDRDQNVHSHLFYNELKHAIETYFSDTEKLGNYVAYVSNYANNRYGNDRIVAQWEATLTNLQAKYASVESRKTQAGEMFNYRVG